MKINVPTNPRKPTQHTIKEVVNLLNRKTNSDIFKLEGDNRIGVSGNANAELHTRLVMLCGLWFCLHNSDYGCYTAVRGSQNYGVYFEFGHEGSGVNEFFEFVASLGNVEDITLD